MSSKKWFVEHHGKMLGPTTSEQLKDLASKGRIQPTTKVRLGKEGQWVLAGKVNGLFGPTEPPQTVAPKIRKDQPPPLPVEAVPAIVEKPKQPSSVANVAPVAYNDSKLATFISDGQPLKVVGKLLSRVEQLCTASENAEYIAVQHLPSITSPDAVVLTNRRVIMFRGKSLGRMSFVDVSWYDVKNIQLSEGIVGASLTVVGMNGHVETIGHLPKEQARNVYRVGQEREEMMRDVRRQRKMEEERNAAGSVVVNNEISSAGPAGGNDLTARLQQLKSMFEAGLISETEFESKKAEILSQI